jgi:diguanylate cyclase (GGDEF)-like protein/PAS domain S-box-containing protein
METSDGARSRTRLIPLWPVLAIGLLVSSIAVYSILRLQADNHRSHRVATVLAQFEGAVVRQNGLGWEAITRRRVPDGFEEEMRSRRARAADALSELASSDYAPEWAEPLTQGYTAYTDSQDQSLDLLTSGDVDAALQVQEDAVEPRFEVLRGWISLVAAASNSDAERTNRLTGAGSVAILLAAAATIGVLLWRYERARGTVALALARQDSLRASEEQFRTAFERSAIGVALVAPDGAFLQVNQALCSMLGYDQDGLRSCTIVDITAGDDRRGAGALMRHLLEDAGRADQIELRMHHRRGQIHWMLISASLVRSPIGSPLHFIMQFQDMTERKALQEELTYRAFQDTLTSLPNRTLFMDRLEQACAAKRSAAVLFLDLDGFKTVNDSLGHAAGDRLLVQVARRLTACLPPTTTVARFGGDEFTVLVEDLIDSAHATSIGGRCLAVLYPPFEVGDREIRISASIGISIRRSSVEHRDALTAPATADDLLREADIALYQAKATGKGRFAVFDPSMSTLALQRLELVTDLQRAIERGELFVQFQPEIDLETEQIVGAEALIRWRHPRRGTVLPGEFIPVAEETGLIHAIGEWVLLEASHQARAWQALRPSGSTFSVSVNLSVRQLTAAGLVEKVSDTLHETGLDPSRRLKDLGVGLAIDDFGTGYSSLSYLRRFPVDTVKIDRSFTAALARDEGTVAIVGTVTDLAHDLGMQVTAEGIEDADQLAMVRFLGCDRAQGYYVAPPLPAAELTRLLTADALADLVSVSAPGGLNR